MTHQVNKLAYLSGAPLFPKAPSIKAPTNPYIKTPTNPAIKFLKTSSFNFAKTPSGNSYLVSILAFTFGLALTLVLLGARILSSLFASRHCEDGFD